MPWPSSSATSASSSSTVWCQMLDNARLCLWPSFLNTLSLSVFSSNAPSYEGYFQNDTSKLPIPLRYRLQIQCLMELLYGWWSQKCISTYCSIHFLNFLILTVFLSHLSQHYCPVLCCKLKLASLIFSFSFSFPPHLTHCNILLNTLLKITRNHPPLLSHAAAPGAHDTTFG